MDMAAPRYTDVTGGCARAAQCRARPQAIAPRTLHSRTHGAAARWNKKRSLARCQHNQGYALECSARAHEQALAARDVAAAKGAALQAAAAAPAQHRVAAGDEGDLHRPLHTDAADAAWWVRRRGRGAGAAWVSAWRRCGGRALRQQGVVGSATATARLPSKVLAACRLALHAGVHAGPAASTAPPHT